MDDDVTTDCSDGAATGAPASPYITLSEGAGAIGDGATKFASAGRLD